MTDFKWRHFQGDVILWAVRWYCRYPISYRDLEEMLAERGISVDHTTIYRWVQCYAPEMEKRLRWFWRRGFDPSWRLDETYVKVRGKWTYLYRAVDKRGDTIDFYLSPTRSAKAAKRFLGKALRGLKHWEKPATLNTDKAPSYGAAITELKREGKLDRETARTRDPRPTRCNSRRCRRCNSRLGARISGRRSPRMSGRSARRPRRAFPWRTSTPQRRASAAQPRRYHPSRRPERSEAPRCPFAPLARYEPPPHSAV